MNGPVSQAAKQSLEEALAAVENDILVPALAKPAELAAQLCASVAEGTYPPEESGAAAEGAAAAAAADGEGGEESIAATLKHADSVGDGSIHIHTRDTRDARARICSNVNRASSKNPLTRERLTQNCRGVCARFVGPGGEPTEKAANNIRHE